MVLSRLDETVLRLINNEVTRPAVELRMATFSFRGRNKNVRVHGWVEDTSNDDAAYAPVRCVACRQVHYVHPVTGKVLTQPAVTLPRDQAVAVMLDFVNPLRSDRRL